MNSKYIIIILLLSNLSFNSYSQIQKQDEVLTERIYLHTDRSLYFPGETIWFKAYVVSDNNQVTDISDILYVELISPFGKIVETLKLRISDGTSFGDFLINNNVGGTYTIKAYTKWMKNFDKEIYFTKELKVLRVGHPNLLMNLKFDKEAYVKNSEVTANFTIKNLNNKALINKEIKYEVRISGNRYISSKTLTDSNGKSEIKFTLPYSLNTPEVILKVSLVFDYNVMSVSRNVPIILDNIDLQFLPEGGYLLQNVNNTLAFKALTEFGKPANIKAQIVDGEGQLINEIESFHDGMGAFEFEPQNNKKHYARIIKPFVSKLLYELPASKKEGLLLSLIKNDSSEIVFNIYSPDKTKIYFSAKNSNETFFQNEINPDAGWNELSISTKDLPTGIIEFTIYNDKKEPQAERLVFVNKQKDLQISLKTDKEIYSPREKVELEISTTNKKGEAVPADLSIAITDNQVMDFFDDNQDNILSYLLMSSYLKGKIEKPNFYFDPKEEKAEKALDLIMLTNGWRTYYNKNNISYYNAKFQAEKTSIESWSVVNSKKEPVKAIVLILETGGENKAHKIETDETRYFGFIKESGKDYVAVAYTEDNQKVHITKTLFPKEKNKKDKSFIIKQKENNIKIQKRRINKKQTGYSSIKSKSTGDTVMNSLDLSLEECIISSIDIKRVNKNIYTSNNRVYQPLSYYIENSSHGGVANVIIQNKFGSSATIKICGQNHIEKNGPLFVIDDVPYSDRNDEAIISLTIIDIISIYALKPAHATSLYGHRGSNGVIVIKTINNGKYNRKKIRSGKSKKTDILAFNNKQNNTKSFKFSETRQFYVPVYKNKEVSTNIGDDFRQTIYWNPIIQTDENGKAKISFYNSDAITSFKIIAEGIKYNGTPGRKEETYSIQKPLDIDVEVPAYLSVGDTIEIPIIVTNKTDNIINAAFALNLPEELKTVGNVPTTIKIAPNNISAKFIKILPVKASSSSNILIGIRSLEFGDMFSKEVSIRKFDENK